MTLEQGGHQDISLQRYEWVFEGEEQGMVVVGGCHGMGRKPGDGGGLELVLSVQHTSFPVAPAGRMLSWVS